MFYRCERSSEKQGKKKNYFFSEWERIVIIRESATAARRMA
ncbi:MAG: hypothetical protein ACOYI2_04260 [Bacillota bacterium]|jgi:hypothetical protein